MATNAQLEKRIVAIEAVNTAQAARLTALETRDKAHDTALANHEARLVDNNAQITAMGAKIIKLEAVTTGLDNAIADHEARLEALEEEPVPPPPPPGPDPPPPGTRTLLGANDITYLGYYAVDPLIGYYFDIPTGGGGELNFGSGFTHRYVNGQLRFLTYGYISGTLRLVEFAPPANFGDTVTSATNAWRNLNVQSQWHGIWVESATNKFWQIDAIDYPETPGQEVETKSIMTRTLNADGTTSGERGRWGLQGINGRRINGGACAIPQWFQTAHGVGPYAVGFGGYASRMSIGPVSTGPTLYAIPDPHNYPDNTEIPASDFKTLMDHSSGTLVGNWYANGTPTAYDRGIRPSNVTNQFDDWGVAPDGLQRWCWNDHASNTGNWIDNDAGTRSKHGFILVPTFSTGRVWYQWSTLNYEGKCAEIQIFDPARLGEVAAGTRQPWNVKPVARIDITAELAALGHTAGGSNFLNPGCVCGVSFDPTTSKLYVYANSSTNGRKSHVLVYRVV